MKKLHQKVNHASTDIDLDIINSSKKLQHKLNVLVSYNLHQSVNDRLIDLIMDSSYEELKN